MKYNSLGEFWKNPPIPKRYLAAAFVVKKLVLVAILASFANKAIPQAQPQALTGNAALSSSANSSVK